jgi:hypothetical protein
VRFATSILRNTLLKSYHAFVRLVTRIRASRDVATKLVPVSAQNSSRMARRSVTSATTTVFSSKKLGRCPSPDCNIELKKAPFTLLDYFLNKNIKKFFDHMNQVHCRGMEDTGRSFGI